jgi:hypothetical protein
VGSCELTPERVPRLLSCCGKKIVGELGQGQGKFRGLTQWGCSVKYKMFQMNMFANHRAMMFARLWVTFTARCGGYCGHELGGWLAGV